jgi:hypothetical protein
MHELQILTCYELDIAWIIEGSKVWRLSLSLIKAITYDIIRQENWIYGYTAKREIYNTLEKVLQ